MFSINNINTYRYEYMDKNSIVMKYEDSLHESVLLDGGVSGFFSKERHLCDQQNPRN